MKSEMLCPKCGPIPHDKVIIYNEVLKRRNFNICPVLPTCSGCGSEIVFRSNAAGGEGQKLIILTGTCASGKSTTAEALQRKYGYYVIDGDCVFTVVKHKLKIDKFEFNSKEVLEEIAWELDFLIAMGKNAVLSHVILPEDILSYRDMLQSRKVHYKFFVLRPDLDTAIARSKKRTCFTSITPEEWVRFFHDKINQYKPDKDIIIFDNSPCTLEESADKIMEAHDSHKNDIIIV